LFARRIVNFRNFTSSMDSVEEYMKRILTLLINGNHLQLIRTAAQYML